MFCCYIRRKSNRQAQTFDCVFSQCYIYHSQNKVSRINLLYIWGILRLIAKFLDLIFLIFILYLSTCWTGHVFFFSSVALQPQRPNRLMTFDFTQFLSSENVWSRLVPLTFHLPPCKAEWVHIDWVRGWPQIRILSWCSPKQSEAQSTCAESTNKGIN